MNFRIQRFSGLLLPVLLLVCIGLPLFAGPFDEKAKSVVSGSGNSSFEKDLESFEKSVTSGLDSAGKSLDELSRTLRDIARDVQSPTSGTTAKAPAEPGTTSSGSIWGSSTSSSSTSTGTGKKVGDAFSQFIRSVGSMFKAIGKWGSAVWKEITGPDKDEAPITNAINSVRTDWAGIDVKSSAKTAAQATVDLGTAIAGFVKQLFS